MTNELSDQSESDLKAKLRNSPAARSLLMEYKVGRLLQEQGWTVSQSPYYPDPQTAKLREIDVLAEQRWMISIRDQREDFVNLQLVIECKSAKAFHLLFGPESRFVMALSDRAYQSWLGHNDNAVTITQTLIAEGLSDVQAKLLLKRFEEIAAPEGTYRHQGYDITPAKAKFRTPAFRETDTQKEKEKEKESVLWRAILSLMSAMDSRIATSLVWKLERLGWAARRVQEDFEEYGIELFDGLAGDFSDALKELYVFHPIVVVDSQLWKVGPNDLESIDWRRLKLCTLGGKDWWFDVVHAPRFETYAASVTKHYAEYFAEKQAQRMGL